MVYLRLGMRGLRSFVAVCLSLLAGFRLNRLSSICHLVHPFPRTPFARFVGGLGRNTLQEKEARVSAARASFQMLKRCLFCFVFVGPLIAGAMVAKPHGTLRTQLHELACGVMASK